MEIPLNTRRARAQAPLGRRRWKRAWRIAKPYASLVAAAALLLLGDGVIADIANGPTKLPPPQTLLFVGDIMLSRSVGAKMKARNDWEYPFEKIAGTLRAADLAIGNLECPVSDVGRNLHHLYSFRADPRAIDGLKFAGFGVIQVANNHMDDWDRPALLDTVRRLRQAGLRPVGAGVNDLEAHYPVMVNLHGVKLAFLAYVGVEPKNAAAAPDQPGVAWLDADRALSDIRFARPLADVVIVCLHWGVEYAKRPGRSQTELAHRMIDAGADLVVGGHPHVVQPCEFYHGHWIAYSLGNFVFDQHWPVTHRGIMLKVTLTGPRVTSAMPIPITIDNSFQASVTPTCVGSGVSSVGGKNPPPDTAHPTPYTPHATHTSGCRE